MSAINRFIDQIKSDADFSDSIEYYAGRVAEYRTGKFIVTNQQFGAQETFSVGQPVYDMDGNLLGYFGISLFENLDYYYGDGDVRIPVETWTICMPTEYCVSGVSIQTYWQKEKRNERID